MPSCDPSQSPSSSSTHVLPATALQHAAATAEQQNEVCQTASADMEHQSDDPPMETSAEGSLKPPGTTLWLKLLKTTATHAAKHLSKTGPRNIDLLSQWERGFRRYASQHLSSSPAASSSSPTGQQEAGRAEGVQVAMQVAASGLLPALTKELRMLETAWIMLSGAFSGQLWHENTQAAAAGRRRNRRQSQQQQHNQWQPLQVSEEQQRGLGQVAGDELMPHMRVCFDWVSSLLLLWPDNPLTSPLAAPVAAAAARAAEASLHVLGALYRIRQQHELSTACPDHKQQQQWQQQQPEVPPSSPRQGQQQQQPELTAQEGQHQQQQGALLSVLRTIGLLAACFKKKLYSDKAHATHPPAVELLLLSVPFLRLTTAFFDAHAFLLLQQRQEQEQSSNAAAADTCSSSSSSDSGADSGSSSCLCSSIGSNGVNTVAGGAAGSAANTALQITKLLIEDQWQRLRLPLQLLQDAVHCLASDTQQLQSSSTAATSERPSCSSTSSSSAGGNSESSSRSSRAAAQMEALAAAAYTAGLARESLGEASLADLEATDQNDGFDVLDTMRWTPQLAYVALGSGSAAVGVSSGPECMEAAAACTQLAASVLASMYPAALKLTGGCVQEEVLSARLPSSEHLLPHSLLKMQGLWQQGQQQEQQQQGQQQQGQQQEWQQGQQQQGQQQPGRQQQGLQQQALQQQALQQPEQRAWQLLWQMLTHHMQQLLGVTALAAGAPASSAAHPDSLPDTQRKTLLAQQSLKECITMFSWLLSFAPMIPAPPLLTPQLLRMIEAAVRYLGANTLQMQPPTAAATGSTAAVADADAAGQARSSAGAPQQQQAAAAASPDDDAGILRTVLLLCNVLIVPASGTAALLTTPLGQQLREATYSLMSTALKLPEAGAHLQYVTNGFLPVATTLLGASVLAALQDGEPANLEGGKQAAAAKSSSPLPLLDAGSGAEGTLSQHSSESESQSRAVEARPSGPRLPPNYLMAWAVLVGRCLYLVGMQLQQQQQCCNDAGAAVEWLQSAAGIHGSKPHPADIALKRLRVIADAADRLNRALAFMTQHQQQPAGIRSPINSSRGTSSNSNIGSSSSTSSHSNQLNQECAAGGQQSSNCNQKSPRWRDAILLSPGARFTSQIIREKLLVVVKKLQQAIQLQKQQQKQPSGQQQQQRPRHQQQASADIVTMLQELAQHLEAVGEYTAGALPCAWCCNAPGCTNLATMSESLELVACRGCVCGGCVGRAAPDAAPACAAAARYCSRKCQRLHKEQHKGLCIRLHYANTGKWQFPTSKPSAGHA